jgi:hypothetical protein
MSLEEQLIKLNNVVKKMAAALVSKSTSDYGMEVTYNGITFYIDFKGRDFINLFISNIYSMEGIDVPIFSTEKPSVENFDMKEFENLQEENRKLKSIIKKMIVNGWVEDWVDDGHKFQKVINYKFCNKIDLRFQCESGNPNQGPADALDIFYNYITAQGLQDLEKHYFS